MRHNKRVVKNGKAFYESKEVTIEDCDNMQKFRKKKIENLDKQIKTLQEQRSEHAAALEVEIKTKKAIESGGDFSG